MSEDEIRARIQAARGKEKPIREIVNDLYEDRRAPSFRAKFMVAALQSLPCRTRQRCMDEIVEKIRTMYPAYAGLGRRAHEEERDTFIQMAHRAQMG